MSVALKVTELGQGASPSPGTPGLQDSSCSRARACMCVLGRVSGRSPLKLSVIKVETEPETPFRTIIGGGDLDAMLCPTLVTPWTVAHQAPLTMGILWQEYWCGLPFPAPGDLPDPGIEPGSPALQADSSPTELQGKPSHYFWNHLFWPKSGQQLA